VDSWVLSAISLVNALTRSGNPNELLDEDVAGIFEDESVEYNQYDVAEELFILSI